MPRLSQVAGASEAEKQQIEAINMIAERMKRMGPTAITGSNGKEYYIDQWFLRRLNEISELLVADWQCLVYTLLLKKQHDRIFRWGSFESIPELRPGQRCFLMKSAYNSGVCNNTSWFFLELVGRKRVIGIYTARKMCLDFDLLRYRAEVERAIGLEASLLAFTIHEVRSREMSFR
jgi:hypothetical protein